MELVEKKDKFKLGRVPGSCGGFVRDEEGRNMLT
jgi:hypothetical protein